MKLHFKSQKQVLSQAKFDSKRSTQEKRSEQNHDSDQRYRVAIETLGCRLNQYESDAILQSFVESGRYTAVPMDATPDIVIINTCTVTHQADLRNKASIRRALRRNPSCRLVVTGCYAQTDPEALAGLGIALLVGNDKKSRILEHLENFLQKERGENLEEGCSSASGFKDKNRPTQAIAKSAQETQSTYEASIQKKGNGLLLPAIEAPFLQKNVRPISRARAYLKVQDGCDKTCSYCKIPLARGRGVSRPISEVLEHVEYLEAQGVPELILTGVNLGWYRDKAASVRFTELLEKILDRIQHARLRLSSIEPCDVDAPLAELTLHPKFCDFLHVPLQSGSQAVLRAMRRSYTPYSFLKRIETVRRFNPHIFLGTDLMIGFPTETDADFQETLQLCRDTQMAKLHIFPFSKRKGTRASAYPSLLPRERELVKERMHLAKQLNKQLWLDYAHTQLGQKKELVIEKLRNQLESGDATKQGIVEGLSDNFLRVELSFIEQNRGQQKLGRGDRVLARLDSINATASKIEGSLAM